MQFDAFKKLVEDFGFAVAVDGSTVHVCPKDDLTASRWALPTFNDQVSGDEKMFRKELTILGALEADNISGAVELSLEDDD